MPPAPTATVMVDASATGLTFPAHAVGLNTLVQDPLATHATLGQQLQDIGVTAIRWASGAVCDCYDWPSNTYATGITPPGPDYVQHPPNVHGGPIYPGNSFDSFAAFSHGLGMNMIVSVCYGCNATGTGGGDPAVAADWVRHIEGSAPVRGVAGLNYGTEFVTHYTIGAEQYRGQAYLPPFGSGDNRGFEPNLWSGKTAADYGTNARAFIQQMKAASQGAIKVGVCVFEDGSPWSSNTGHPFDGWNPAVLAACGDLIDFVDLHPYAQAPFTETDAGLLQVPTQLKEIVLPTIRAQIAEHCGSNAAHVGITISDVSSGASPGKQSMSPVQCLFTADMVATALESGVQAVHWFTVGGGIYTTTNMSPDLFGDLLFGTYDLFSIGQSSGGVSEPPIWTYFPPAYGLKALKMLAVAGDVFLHAASSSPFLGVHAARHTAAGSGDTSLALMLSNRLPVAQAVTVTIGHYTPPGAAAVYTYGPTGPNTSIGAFTAHPNQAGFGASFTTEIPAYSMVVITQ